MTLYRWPMLSCKNVSARLCNDLGGRPGLVVMGGDSCSEGCGFEPQYRILDGH